MALVTFGGFILGIVVSVLIDYFLPDHVDTEELLHPDAPEEDNHFKHYKLKEPECLLLLAICVHNFPEGMATFLTTNTGYNIRFFSCSCNCNP